MFHQDFRFDSSDVQNLLNLPKNFEEIWQLDINKILENYLETIRKENFVDFIRASFVVEACAKLYGKKVTSLCNIAADAADKLFSPMSKENPAQSSKSKNASNRKSKELGDFVALDDLKPCDPSLINLADPRRDQLLPLRGERCDRLAPAFLTHPDCEEKRGCVLLDNKGEEYGRWNGFAMNSGCYHSTGAFLLSSSDKLELLAEKEDDVTEHFPSPGNDESEPDSALQIEMGRDAGVDYETVDDFSNTFEGILEYEYPSATEEFVALDDLEPGDPSLINLADPKQDQLLPCARRWDPSVLLLNTSDSEEGESNLFNRFRSEECNTSINLAMKCGPFHRSGALLSSSWRNLDEEQSTEQVRPHDDESRNNSTEHDHLLTEAECEERLSVRNSAAIANVLIEDLAYTACSGRSDQMVKSLKRPLDSAPGSVTLVEDFERASAKRNHVEEIPVPLPDASAQEIDQFRICDDSAFGETGYPSYHYTEDTERSVHQHASGDSGSLSLEALECQAMDNRCILYDHCQENQSDPTNLEETQLLKDPISENPREQPFELRLQQYFERCRAKAPTNQLFAEVQKWKEKVKSVLEETESRKPFDIREYGENLMRHLENGTQVLPFDSVCRGLQKWEVCRYFVASLQMVNDYEIEVSFNQ